MFLLMASLCVGTQAIIEELQVVCEFPEVFPDEILMYRQRGKLNLLWILYLVPELFLWHRTGCLHLNCQS